MSVRTRSETDYDGDIHAVNTFENESDVHRVFESQLKCCGDRYPRCSRPDTASIELRHVDSPTVLFGTFFGDFAAQYPDWFVDCLSASALSKPGARAALVPARTS
jgi:hypothetical protein